MESIVKINNKKNIEIYSSVCSGFIVGLKNFSVDFDDEFDINEIGDLINKYPKKSIFVSVNKNIFNKELDLIEEVLIKLNKLNIKAVLFYDLAILYIKQKNKLDINLVWNQTHMVTNYNTCNYYNKKGVSYAFVSGEITLDEIIQISENSNINLLVEVVGKQIMSHSKRTLLTNYYSSINKKYDGKLKIINEKEDKYIIKEDKNGTVIKTFEVLNGISVIPNLIASKISYIVIDESDVSNDKIYQSLCLINEIICGHNVEENIQKSYDILGKNTSFFFKKTIYKVKKGEK